MTRHVDDVVGGGGKSIARADRHDAIVLDVEATAFDLAPGVVHRDEHLGVFHEQRFHQGLP